MTEETSRRLIVFFIVFAFLLLPLAPTGQAKKMDEPPPKPVKAEEINPRLETVLLQLEIEREAGPAQAELFAEAKNITMTEDRVTVVIEPQTGEINSIDRDELGKFGVRINASSRTLVRATVPVANLSEVANQVQGIGRIRLPFTPHPTVTQKTTVETIDKTGATSYHEAGFKGQGTNIAVIDIGFNGLSEAIQSGDLPESVIGSKQDFTETGLESGTSHGTAVAEIVHDMAPEANLHLKKIGDDLDLENAKDSASEQGVDVINHSVAWLNLSYYDGTGRVSGIASDSRSEGILWVNSAGNYALRHWQGNFTGNGDSWHDFEEGDECNGLSDVNAGDIVRIYMTWNDWPETDQDYDLYLSDNQGEIVASSTAPQDGNQMPSESIYYQVSQEAELPVCFGVQNYDAPDQPEIDVFSINHSLQYPVPEKSLIDPAVDENVLAVGAIAKDDWSTGPQEPFSSQGPTNDGRTKPDIMGPDGVSTSIWEEFYGTSASSPHLAGAASLILSREAKSPDSLQNSLETSAIDMGAPGKDNLYGSGRLDLSLENCRIVSTTLEEGWNLFSPPGTPQNPDPETALGDDLDNPIIYRWNPAGGKYIGGRASSSDLQLTAGAGYWLYVREGEGAPEIDMNVCLPSSASIDLPDPGWQMVGSPFPVNWGDVRVNGTRVRDETSGGLYGGPLSPYLFTYEKDENEYLVSKSETWNDFGLTNWDGYWIRTTDPDVELSFVQPDSTGTNIPSANRGKQTTLNEVKLTDASLPPGPPIEPSLESPLKAVAYPSLIRDDEKVKFLIESDRRVEGLRARVLNLDGEVIWSDQGDSSELAWEPAGKVTNGIYLYEVSAKINGEFKKAGIGKLLVLK